VSERATGNIYDLGYRNYAGERLGRSQAFVTLYIHSLRASFGFGRRTVSKLFPVGFAVIAFIPALIQLGIGAFTSSLNADVELFAHEDYYGFIQIILLLFCATTAPELAGRDQRTHTLSLYFSRALRREDYAIAKLAALVTAMLVLTLGDQIGPIVASALLISGIIASIGLAIGAYVPRRSYATVAILAAFIIPITVANILIETTDPEVSRYFLLLSPTIFEGFTLWFFNAPVDSEALLDADFAGYIYLLAGLAWLAIGAVFLVRRFQRVTA